MESEYAVATNEMNKATELSLSCSKLGRNPKHGAHMRAFWAATISFFLAFFGWFALSPVALEVAESIGICENAVYPPKESAKNAKRTAFLKYKKVDSEEAYCIHGKDDDDNPTDCNESPVHSRMPKYDFDVLPSCVCTPGTSCYTTLLLSSIGSVGVTIFVRIALGTLLERFGPVNMQSTLLLFGACWVLASAFIWDEWSLIVIRTMIGCVGGTFVTNQFWVSLMFAPNKVGTANATAAGWGNLGGGVTQIFIVWCLFTPLSKILDDDNLAWRFSMVVPAVLFVVIAVAMKLCCWDMPSGPKFKPADSGKQTKATLCDYMECLKDVRVLVMIFQYSACFGAELAMNSQLALYFRTYFELKSGAASVLAGSFGFMNLFARSLGGILSDHLNERFGFRGRLWAQFFALFFEAVFLFGFGLVDSSLGWYAALPLLICFSLFVQMAEGTSYSVVPFMIPWQLACVSALVGAGGNMGAVVAIYGFYLRLGEDEPRFPYQVHAGYVLLSALLTAVYYWPDKGGLFAAPAIGSAKKGEQSDDEASAAGAT